MALILGDERRDEAEDVLMRTPVAYLRKSRSDDPTRELSRQVQESAVRALAARDGHDGDLRLYVDWDRSADESKSHRRIEYNKMLRAIAADEVAVVYAYAADRLYRSLEGFVQLTGAADKHGVKIVTQRDGVINGDGSPMAEFHSGLGALVAKLELSTAKSRARGAYEARVARGDRIGRPPYGWALKKDADGVVQQVPDPEHPLEPLIDAYTKADRRVRTAVRILNDEVNLPAPHGGDWDRSSLLRIITRERPDLLPRRTANGRKEAAADAPARLSKLLRCPCGRFLTPNRHVERRLGHGKSERVTMGYYCARGQASRAEHPRMSVSEAKVLPWVADEAARYVEPDEESVLPARDIEQERADLAGRRTRVVELRIARLIGLDETRRRLEAIDKELAALYPPPAGPDLTNVDWTRWSDRKINDVLRSLFAFVQLDEMYRPVRAEWHVPAWRSAD